MINLTIDGKNVSVKVGATVLEAARSAGVDIPTLCYYEGIEPCVSCFVCAVKVDGRDNFVPACSTMAFEGMVIDTCSEEVIECRKCAIDLLLSVHAGECEAACMKGDRDPAKCKISGRAKCFRCACEDMGSCKLREYALRYGVTFYSYRNSIDKTRTVYDSGLTHEPGKCIVCGKCIAITKERGVKPGLAFSGRGSEVRVVAPFGTAFDEAMGSAMEECVEACPTVALRIGK